ERRVRNGALIGESVAPTVAPILQVLGVLPEIQRAGFLRCEQTRARWSGEPDNVQQNRAAVIDEPGRVDGRFVDAAGRPGTALLWPARARTPFRGALGWRVPVEAATGAVTIEAAFLVDARGRRSGLAPAGAPTVALCGRWRGTGPIGMAEMRIEAGPDCWFWG